MVVGGEVDEDRFRRDLVVVRLAQRSCKVGGLRMGQVIALDQKAVGTVVIASLSIEEPFIMIRVVPDGGWHKGRLPQSIRQRRSVHSA